MKKDTELWLNDARENLDVARLMLDKDHLSTASFYGHQCAERALKAVIIEAEDELVRSHDLVELGKRTGLPAELITACPPLTLAYLDQIYVLPDSRQYTKENVAANLATAEAILNWASERIDSCWERGSPLGNQEPSRKEPEKKKAEEFTASQPVLDGLKAFRKALREKMQVDRIIFFGSRASGAPHRDSDIDLVIVSRDFEGKPRRERALGFHEMWNLEYPVDFLCYTPQEYEDLRNRVTIVREAVRTGIEIK
jgi:HEPN domain-containing protein/predicted nucleotidyltransferase